MTDRNIRMPCYYSEEVVLTSFHSWQMLLMGLRLLFGTEDKRTVINQRLKWPININATASSAWYVSNQET